LRLLWLAASCLFGWVAMGMGIRNKPGPTRNYEEVTKAMATATASGAAAKTQNYLHSTAATNVAAVLPCATYCCHLMAMARCRCFCPVTSNIQHPTSLPGQDPKVFLDVELCKYGGAW